MKLIMLIHVYIKDDSGTMQYARTGIVELLDYGHELKKDVPLLMWRLSREIEVSHSRYSDNVERLYNSVLYQLDLIRDSDCEYQLRPMSFQLVSQ